MADTNDTPSLEQEINELVEKLADDTFDKAAVDPVNCTQLLQKSVVVILKVGIPSLNKS